ncbi:TorF family putative porin (plasmid) [Pseudoalteromonas sp. T1lg65]|uniref:TorF family putative porin n=1 Tax=Pseudoalteromonas sp. T1lg65 TaxID=2077101 RepID=UPI003F7AAB79
MEIKKVATRSAVSLFMLCCSLSVQANLSSTVTIASDYLYNGVSKTKESEALQASLDWFNSSGLYASGAVSEVDFAGGTELEGNFYGGYRFALSQTINMDVGMSQYTFHGDGGSSELNYAQAYSKFRVGRTVLNIQYAWDYLGTGADHGIIMLTHTFLLSEQFSIMLGVDHSVSFDDGKFEWESGDNDYTHWHLTGTYSFLNGFAFSLGYSANDIDSYAGSTFVASLSKTFELN